MSNIFFIYSCLSVLMCLSGYLMQGCCCCKSRTLYVGFLFSLSQFIQLFILFFLKCIYIHQFKIPYTIFHLKIKYYITMCVWDVYYGVYCTAMEIAAIPVYRTTLIPCECVMITCEVVVHCIMFL